MSKFNRLVLGNFSHDELNQGLWSRIESCAETVVVTDRPSSEFDAAIAEADGLILRLGMTADLALFDSAPNLRYVGMYGTGYGRIDIQLAKERGIVVTNVADYSTEAVAELTVAMALLVRRNLLAESERASRGDVDETTFSGRDLSSLSVGIVGAGHIGTRVAELLLSGFKSKVNYWNRTRKPNLEQLGAAYLELDELVSSSDIVSIHLASNADTNGVLNERVLQEFKQGSLLINTSPNELIDFDCTLDQCRSGKMSFAMDHADELEESSLKALLGTPNVLVLPPIGYATTESSENKEEILVANVEAYLNGDPRNHVNP